MLNFDITITKGKKTFEIKNNKVITPSGTDEINATDSNHIINQWLPMIEAHLAANKIANSFDDLVKDVNYLQDALHTIKSLKQRHCSWSNKTLEDLQEKVMRIAHGYYEQIQNPKFSEAQDLILKKLCDLTPDFEIDEVEALYDVVNEDTSKLDQWWKDLNSFDYKKYGVHKEDILSKESSAYYHTGYAKQVYDKVLERIKNFKVILKESGGDDLINWSQQKISLRFTKLGIKATANDIYTLVDRYIEHLVAKGVQKGKKVKTSKDKLDDVVKSGNPTQEELFRYYKQSSSGYTVLEKMDLEHLFLIIDSNLKCVTDKIGEKEIGGYRSRGDFGTIVNLLCEKSVTKQDYKKIIAWAGLNHVPFSFMNKHRKDASTQEVVAFCKATNWSEEEPLKDFFETCLSKIPQGDRKELRSGWTYQYMTQMTDAEKVSFLSKISEYNVEFGTLYNLYQDIDYSLIRDTIRSNEELLNHLAEKVADENDHDTLLLSCKKVGQELSTDKRRVIFQKLTHDERTEVIKHDIKTGKNDCYPPSTFASELTMFTQKELNDLLQNLIDLDKAGKYVEEIFVMSKSFKEANRIVKGMKNVEKLPLTTSVIKHLSVATKVELLHKGLSLLDEQDWYTKEAKTSETLGECFFSDFTRENIQEVYGSPLDCRRYKKFLAHVMLPEELISCAETDTNFLRYNIEHFTYEYLKKFKNKELFRKIVGDQRNRSNLAFGKKILEKLNITQSMEYFVFGEEAVA